MARLEELVIENFRGAASPLRLSFQKDKPITLIFGENGTGKTTIVDAIDLVANGSIGSIRDKSSTSVSAHSPTMGKATGDIRVAVTTSDGTWAGSVKSSKVIVDPVPGPSARILRRSNLQRFIDAKPADRYSELRYLIAVDQVEKSERALGDVMNYAANTANSFARDRENAHAMLQSIWVREGCPGNDPVSWAESQLQQDVSGFEEQKARLQQAIQILRSMQDSARVHEESAQQLALASTELNAVREQLEMTPVIGLEQSIQLSRVLHEVQAFLEASDPAQQCPVCEQPVIGNNLQATVAVRLHEMQAYRELDNRRIAWQRKQVLAQENVRSAEERLMTSGQAVMSVADMGTFQLEDEDRSLLTADDPSGLTSLTGRLLDNVEKQRDELHRMSGRLNALHEALTSIMEAEQEASEYVRKQAALRTALDIVRTQRHLYSKRLLDEVAQETNRLYEYIHPGEGLAISRLELDPKHRASLNQGVTFAGSSDVPPQAYFSEAHLDTLGFCFWLAVAKREAKAGPLIIVIDDVFSSVDAQHLTRITNLITEESTAFDQTILTTHHRTVRETFRNSYGAGRITDLIDLHGDWSLARGIMTSNAPLAIDELRDVLARSPLDRQAVASKAGVLLEAVLDKLALQYRCKVPRSTDNSYNLNELLDSTSSLMKKLAVERADGTPRVLPKEIIQGIRLNNLVRNQVGAHYNVHGHDIPDRDVRDFADLAVRFAESVTCPWCGQIPFKPIGSAFRCGCSEDKRTTMTPRAVD